MRAVVGWTTVVLGLIMFSTGVRYHYTLWTGIKTKTVVKEVVKEVVKTIPQPTTDTPTNIPQERLDKGQLSTGALKIQNVYENTGKNGNTTGVASGDYQVIDVNNKIWMLRLCSPETKVPVKFKVSSWVNIVYTKEENCYRFVSATLLQEEVR
jgi:hypothetical protein